MLHLVSIGNLTDLQSRISQSQQIEQELDYSQIVELVVDNPKKRDKPRVLSRQLQMSILLVNYFARHLHCSSNLSAQMWLHRFGQKLRTVFQNS